MQPVVHVGPESDGAVEDAVKAAGGRIGPLEDADAVVWLGSNPESFPDVLPDRVRWVQFAWAGVERWMDKVDDRRVWTSATIAFGRPVAEHALTLMLAGARRIADCARATAWTEPPVRPLDGATIAVVGTGAIGGALIELLAPFRVDVLAVTRRGHDGTIPVDRLSDVLPAAHHVVIAAPATPATRHLIGEAELAAMREDAWLVNVSRGSLVDTEALVAALAAGSIGGAALDVTDPEPLPDAHPLWREPRALITPHVANPPASLRHYLARQVQENVARFANGEELLSPIDPEAGY